MKRNAYILTAALAAACASPLAAQGVIDFESEAEYKAIGVYDVWEESPFRTGALSGNFAITPNPDTSLSDETGEPVNASALVAGAQRSRFGSNRFGLRVDLNESFELTPTTKYVHVLMHKPTEGRVMLVGLGSRQERLGQNPYCEQFWEVSQNTVLPGRWCDAVFAIKGAGGIDIRSLVVVPDCESPHALTEDFLFYIDQIEINASNTPRIITEYYPICGDKATLGMTRTDRGTSALKLNGSADGNQTVNVAQSSNQKIYQDLLAQQFTAKPGERLTPSVTYTGSWMFTYVYIDLNQNGRFEVNLNADGTPAEGNELFSYSGATNGNGSITNSLGQSAGSWSMTCPAFTLPADTKPGLYRMRYKVDWDNTDPMGNGDSGNHISNNGGVIADVMLNVHADNVTVNDFQLNGEVLAADGSKLNALQAPFGQPFAILMNPEKGFTHNGVLVKSGYNLDGEKTDKYGNPQYFETTVLGYEFDENGTYTLPASVMTGNVLINGQMVEVGTQVPTGPVYPLNFPEDLTIARTDRALSSLTLNPTEGGTAVTIDCSDNTARRVYLNKLTYEVSVKAGAQIIPSVNYSGRPMHTYYYIDLNEDGMFSSDLNTDGTPAAELLSYSHYNGLNSTGATQAPSIAPSTNFPITIPADTKPGVYRGRFKIDWNNIDPAGQYSSAPGATNQINDNGGYVVDFLVHVLPETVTVSQRVDNSDTVGHFRLADGTSVDTNPEVAHATEVLVSHLTTTEHHVKSVTLRRGYHLDGQAQYMGNTYWTEVQLSPNENGHIVVPATMVDRPLLLHSAEYEQPTSLGAIAADADSADAEYDVLGRRIADKNAQGIHISRGHKTIVKK